MNVRVIAAGLLTACACRAALAAAGADGNIVANGSFEQVEASGRATSWSRDGDVWSFPAGCGVGGTRAVLFDNADTNYYGGAKQTVAAVPGRNYFYGAKIRTEGLRNGKAMICVEWYRANGKYIAGSYVRGVDYSAGWTEVTGDTGILPEDAARVVVMVFCERKSVGKAYFDDVWMKEQKPPRIDGLYSSRYRDAAASGRVAFRAALNLTAEEQRQANGTFVLPATEPGGAERRLPATIAEDAATVSCDVSGFAAGENRVRFELSGDGTGTNETAEIRFRRVTEADEAAPTVRIDRFGRTLVGGKPFFPLGMYLGKVNEPELKTYAEGAFNLVLPYELPDRAQMDLCEKYGLKVIYNVVGRDLSDGTFLARFKDHPALLAWYLNDEKPVSERDNLTAACQAVARHDPNHPSYSVISRYDQTRSYLPTSDVLGSDVYPLYTQPIAQVTECMTAVRRGLMGLKPMWHVVQVHDKAAYAENPKAPGVSRPPTFVDMRNMAWQALAGGANGLIFYSYFDLIRMNEVTSFAQRWGEVKDIAAEIKAHEDFFLSAECPPRMTSSSDKLVCRAWRKDNRVFAVVVNTVRELVVSDITLDGVTRRLEIDPVGVRFVNEKLSRGMVISLAFSSN